MLQSNAPTEVSVLTGNPIRYLSSQAEWTRGSNEDPPDEDAARWWAAILATGEGWRAEFTHDGAVYRSPWSICIADVRRFRPPRKYSPQDMCEHTSASSEAALGYLSDFSMLHCLNSQCSVALAAALTFPFLGTWTVTLPLPIPLANSMFKIGHAFRVESCPSKITIQEEIELLPYYMTLSCNRRGMHSLVCGSFFDPQVSCNLVSSWFQPILDIIGPLVKAGDYEKIAIIMARRQPRLAALWMGAIISGMAEMILQWVRSGMSAIELHASAWTGTTQSFISLKPEVPRATDDSEIPRSDECRLLYLAEGEGYSRLPVCPWQPFGATLLRNTEIEVRLHATCTDHYLRYISWTWDLDDETALEDRGFTCDTEPLDTCGKVDDVLPLDAPKTTFPSDEMLSESATRCIFGWLRGSSGWPECEKEIHCHSWIASEVSDEGSQDSNSDNEFSLSIDTKQSIEGWLEQQELHDGKQ